MTDSKITALPAFVPPMADTDLLTVVQGVGSSPETREMTHTQLITMLSEHFAGASVSLFLEGTDSDISGYKSLQLAVPQAGAQNSSASISAADTLIKAFAATADQFTFIPVQVALVHLHLVQSAGSKTSTAYVKLYHRTSGGTETLLGTSAVSSTIPGSETEFNFDVSVPDTVFLSTDRFVLKVYASPVGAGTTPTVAVYYNGTTNSRVNFGGTRTITLSTDGWNAGATWTYASASTFTVSGDATATYRKGTRLKWVQTTTKYGVVVGSSYGAPNTTVTIAVNSDYTIANAPITLNYYSYILNPEGYPHYYNFAVTHGGFTGGAEPTYVCRYKIDGTTYTMIYRSVTNGTSNSTDFTVTMAVTAKNLTNYYPYSTMAFYVDNGGNGGPGVMYATPNSNVLTLLKASAAAWTNTGNKSANFVLVLEF